MVEARLPCQCETSSKLERFLDCQSTNQSILLLDECADDSMGAEGNLFAIDEDFATICPGALCKSVQ